MISVSVKFNCGSLKNKKVRKTSSFVFYAEWWWIDMLVISCTHSCWEDGGISHRMTTVFVIFLLDARQKVKDLERSCKDSRRSKIHEFCPQKNKKGNGGRRGHLARTCFPFCFVFFPFWLHPFAYIQIKPLFLFRPEFANILHLFLTTEASERGKIRKAKIWLQIWRLFLLLLYAICEPTSCISLLVDGSTSIFLTTWVIHW